MKYFPLSAAVLAVLGLSVVAAPPPPMSDIQDFVYLGDKGPVLLRFHVRIDGKPFVAVWEEFMGRLFAYLDKNGDGVLSKDEAARVPPVQVLFNNGPGFAGQRPNISDAIDKNRDGKITREELAEWYRRIGAAPFQFQSGNAPQSPFVVIFAGQTQPPSADALNEKLFTMLDANKDGKLSREELSPRAAILPRLDLDDDETVSIAEMNGNVDRGTESTFVVAGTMRPQVADNKVPFLLVGSADGRKDLARRLLDRYAPKGKKQVARKLTRKDVGLDEATFARLDADEDGALDSEELAHFAARPPDLEFRVRLGKKGDKEAAVERIAPKDATSPIAKTVRDDSDGTLRMEFGSTQIQLGHGNSSSNPQYARLLRQQYLAQFRMADKDNNGYLDKTETEQNPLYRNLFRTMDRDSDGKLFEKEVTAYLDKMKELQEGALRSCASLTVKDQGRGLFDLVDANGDGRLSLRELRRAVKLVDSLDRDGDDSISRNEIPHKYRVEVRRGPASGNQFTPRVVAIRRMGTTEPALPQRTAGPRWFRKMDRNHDGDVSRREFLGTEKEFKKIDADGDGLLSAEEADRADRAFRKEKEGQP